jgi:hypothetical protein
MGAIDFKFTIKIIIIVAVAVLLLNALTEIMERLIFKIFGLDKEAISSWVKIALFALVALFILMYLFKIEAHDVLGISETVDTLLTGTTESFNGKTLVHSKA